MTALVFGLIAAGLAAFGSFASSMKQGNAQRQQAAQMEANAELTRRNAAVEAERGMREAYEQDRRKAQLRRHFMRTQSQNRLALGAGNVDMTSGSALDVSLGNIDNFAADMGENAYAAAMKKWETGEREKSMQAQANALDSNASYLKKTAATVGTSLLTAGISGLGGFAGGYSMGGGKLTDLLSFGSSTGGIESLAPGTTSWGAMPRAATQKWLLNLV